MPRACLPTVATALGWLFVLAVCVGLGVARPALAANIHELTLDRTEEGLFLSSMVDVELGPAVEDALQRSVPVYFVTQAEVLRERWYWSDKRVASVSRTYRLAYQPLTRRWRVSVSSGSGPGVGFQYALHQNHPSLAQAMTTITRLADWPLVEASRLDPDGNYRVEYRFKLDMALLPRPFQLGMNAQTDWNLDLRQSLLVPALSTPDQMAPAGAEKESLLSQPPAAGASPNTR